MTDDLGPEPSGAPVRDPFLAKLRALRESLPASAREVRYRLEEMEYRLRLLEASADSRATP